MPATAEKTPTFAELYAEIEALPQGVTGEILVPGTLRTMSRPARPHRRAARRLARALDAIDVNVGGSGWWIELEAEVRFGDRLTVPDLAGWRVERLPVFPDDNPIVVLPDWCCEVLSPTTAREDRVVKLPLYAREGVAHVWLVDPQLRTLEVYESVAGRATLTQVAAGDDAVALAPFDLTLALTGWWLSQDATNAETDEP